MHHDLERISRTKPLGNNPARYYSVCECMWASHYRATPELVLTLHREHQVSALARSAR